jgi:hypothetical protein
LRDELSLVSAPLSRRRFGQTLAAAAGLAAINRLHAQAREVVLPERRHILVKGGYVLSMDGPVDTTTPFRQ